MNELFKNPDYQSAKTHAELAAMALAQPITEGTLKIAKGHLQEALDCINAPMLAESSAAHWPARIVVVTDDGDARPN